MQSLCLRFLLLVVLVAWPVPAAAEVVIAEGEAFKPLDSNGWKVTHQNDTYGSHTYGGMWMTHGACLGAPAAATGSVATQTVTVKAPGRYRVWSKYQAPPYFNYLHRIDVVQNGRTVYSHTYGKKGTDRLWSFSGVSDELWWPWGVDHDAAEAPKGRFAELVAGPAELRLTAVANPQPAGDRFVDLVVLTTNPADDYQGFKPYKVGSPFANEAFAATRLYLRFRNTAAVPARLAVRRNGHFQPQYGGATAQFPEVPVPAGQWSAWVNVGPFCRLVHDEGLFLTLPGAKVFAVQFARDEAGKDLVGDLTVESGEAVAVPLEITWQKGARVKTSRQHAREIVAASKTWRRANGGKKPSKILYYGAFSGKEAWVGELKAALGYNTALPPQYDQVQRSGLHAHAHTPKQIRDFAARLQDRDNFLVLSFGDEISLGQVNFKDPKVQEKFRAWAKAKGLTRADLGGVDPAAAVPAKDGNPRLAWYAQAFNETERFADYRAMTRLAKELIGPHVLTGANYSPHHGVLYYGPVYQWIDIFKHQGMSLFWAEDYIFSVPEVPQIISWQFAQMRCAVKYHGQPIHFYVMPHAPGQEAGFLRRNLVLSVGFGARHIDNFWVAPAEQFTENYVGWNYRDTFRTLSEAIYDSAEAERFQAGGTVRPARVGVLLSKATDYNESRQHVDKTADPFARQCKNAPAQLNPSLCRKEQQMLYLALRHAQHAVDLVTEEDVLAGALKDFDVLYVAGEWIDRRAVPKLDAWVKAGGTLYACAGLGRLNQFGEPEPTMLALLGLRGATVERGAAVVRTLLELPHLGPMDTIALGKDRIEAVGMRQRLEPADAEVLGTWQDGNAAVTARRHGKGQVFAVGGLPGTSWMKTAVRPIPFARGGRHTVYNPVDFAPAATKLVRLALDAAKPAQAAVCSAPGVEAIVMDHKDGTLVTLVNWTNVPVKELRVSVRLSARPRDVRSVQRQRALPFEFEGEAATFRVDLDEADYILLPR